jgi:hypothetical protein
MFELGVVIYKAILQYVVTANFLRNMTLNNKYPNFLALNASIVDMLIDKVLTTCNLKSIHVTYRPS